MSNIIQTTLGYVPSVQRLVWPSGTNVPVTAYLWGGGGGGGGFDARPGGAGSGGGFTQVSFTVDAGDVIEVAVGGGGAGGPSSARGGIGGVAGGSYVADVLFDTRTAVTSPPVVPSTNTSYVTFLNTHGVWVNPTTAANFDRSYVVNFPITGIYTFTASADNSAKLYVDDDFIGDVPGFTATYTLTTSVLSGNHTVRIVGTNTGGPGSVALTIDGQVGGGGSYSGGNGGRPGTSGTSGGGGGGGGATVIFKNGIPLAVAGGGGGGGGGGRNSGGESAPGSRGQAAEGVSAGQNGQDRTTDGGGGGGGGGGLGGGEGGLIVSGDSGANAGSFGLSSSPAQNPNGRDPGGRTNLYYTGAAGIGGTGTSNGTNGAAVLLFEVPGVFVHTETSFEPVKQIWIKVNEVWQPVQSTRIKSDGIWKATLDSFTPTFTSTSDEFGVSPRPIDPEAMPPDPAPGPSDSGSGWNYTDGWSFSPSSEVNNWSGSSLGDFGQSSFA